MVLWPIGAHILFELFYNNALAHFSENFLEGGSFLLVLSFPQL